MHGFFHHRWIRLIAGLGTGLLVSGLVLFAFLEYSGFLDQTRLRALETKLHAAAAQSSGSLAVATGGIEPGLEGIFVLDFLSGDLTCGVMNPRTGRIGGVFRRNVTTDLGVTQGKQPKYLMVTGNLEPQGRVSNTRPALSLVYVADSTTGRYAGYMLPWNQQALHQNLPQFQQLVPVGMGSARNVIIE